VTPPIITVRNLGKKYRLNHQGNRQPYTALRDVIADRVKRLFRLSLAKRSTPEANGHPRTEEFWALKGIDFEVKQGEVVGIIGRNGAGKSTLLKILSRITEPSAGTVRIRGRVASLLEVGTGFHPELTGRENIFLNGAILGMTRAEIRQKFDEIVAFAEVEKFLDTPVKRYSSGMYVRLAFAVAAHLEPEILVVDEVLAVGDKQFQAKCIGKMTDVAAQGRTILFVSHNLGAVRALCTRAILLANAKLIAQGEVADVVARYNREAETGELPVYAAPAELDSPFVKQIEISQDNQVTNEFRMDRPIDIRVRYETRGRKNVVFTVLVRNSDGTSIQHSTDEFAKDPDRLCPGERLCRIPAYALAESEYFLTVALSIRDISSIEQKLNDVLKFSVVMAGTMSDKTIGSNWRGVCGPGLLEWA
jgi:lipopolysaccharide transport system ATP-binding protein